MSLSFPPLGLTALSFALCLCLVWIASAATLDCHAQEINVPHIKEVTVFIKADNQCGSGFLIERWDSGGLIATNAHVVMGDQCPKDLEIVFHNGQSSELKLKGKLMSCDPIEDIALIQVRSERLPKPLEIAAVEKLEELQTVFFAGFPLGNRLSTERQSNPEVTVSTGKISSLRRRIIARTNTIQIDASAYPGNSGGPLLNSDGMVIGIITAKIETTSIVFAQTVDKLLDRVRGAGVCVGVARLSGDSSRTNRYVLRGLLSDPYGRLKSAEVRVINSQDIERLAPTLSEKDSWPIFPSLSVLPIDWQGVFFRSQESFLADQFANVVSGTSDFSNTTVQIVCNRKDDSQFVSPPMKITNLLDDGTFRLNRSKDVPDEKGQEIPWPSYKSALTGPSDWEDTIVERESPETAFHVGQTKTTSILSASIATSPLMINGIEFRKIPVVGLDVLPNLLWSADGRYLFWLERNGTLNRINYPEGDDLRSVSFGDPATSLAICKQGVVVSAPKKRSVFLVSPTELRVEKSITDLPDHTRMLASPTINLVWLETHNEQLRCLRLDFEDEKSRDVWEPFHGLEAGADTKFVRQKEVLYGDGPEIVFYRLKNGVLPQVPNFRLPPPISGQSVRIELSPTADKAVMMYYDDLAKSNVLRMYSTLAWESPVWETRLDGAVVQSFSVAWDNMWVLVALQDRRLHSFQEAQNQWAEIRLPNGKQEVLCISPHPNSQTLAVLTSRGIYWGARP
ncbi:S1C family serine protease [Pirellulaceae bacterium SH449]